MKQGSKYTIIFIIFLTIMIVIFSLYSKRYDEVKYLNGGNALLKQLYKIKSGSYEYKNGTIYGSDNIYSSDSYYFEGEGNIEIDKYGNVRFYIDTNNFCVYKNYLSDVKFMKNKCNEFYTLDVNLIKNNNKVSFSSNEINLQYKISDNDDFKGEWIKKDYDSNLIIDDYFDGDNYIWFKNNDGHISDVIKFSVNCLKTNGVSYNNDVFYCSGSVVRLDNIEWVVIKDSSLETTLMSKSPLEIKLSHCTDYQSNYCYYDLHSIYNYKWSASNVNDYLNNIYVNELSDETKSKLVTKYICDEYYSENCNQNNCGGYSKETINRNNWSCTDYSPSIVRLISFDEYNYVYNKIGENNLIKGTYLMINSLSNNKASIVDTDYSVYIEEDILFENNIRPVITLKK